MYFVYIIQSVKDSTLYAGLTADLEERIERHNAGFVISTKNRKPFILLHYELFETCKEAREREKFFKSGYGREILKALFRRPENCPGGGIGRRKGLKIPRLNKLCRFESGPGQF